MSEFEIRRVEARDLKRFKTIIINIYKDNFYFKDIKSCVMERLGTLVWIFLRRCWKVLQTGNFNDDFCRFITAFNRK